MRWIMAHVNGVGAVVFKADPERMKDGDFEFHAPSIVLISQQGVGLAKWVGHQLGAVAKVGRMNRSAVAFWHIIEDNAFEKDCERSWATEPRTGGIAMPTPEAVNAIRNGKGLRLT